MLPMFFIIEIAGKIRCVSWLALQEIFDFDVFQVQNGANRLEHYRIEKAEWVHLVQGTSYYAHYITLEINN
jgi:hypothetical protein